MERVCLSPICKCGGTTEYECNCIRGKRQKPRDRDGYRTRCRRCGATLVTVRQYEKKKAA